MAYIGVSPSNGVRNRFQYQATAGQTSFSGSDANSLTLSYTDSLYMDVYQNGVLLVPGDDYTATTGTTVVLVQAASLNDIVEMVVYDVFSVNETYTKTESDNRYPFLGNDNYNKNKWTDHKCRHNNQFNNQRIISRSYNTERNCYC